jgi:hypothetical protein
LLNGDQSAICWRFEFTGKDGKVRAMEEVAWQSWRGEQLFEERFFYDPKQTTGQALRTAKMAEIDPGHFAVTASTAAVRCQAEAAAARPPHR